MYAISDRYSHHYRTASEVKLKQVQPETPTGAAVVPPTPTNEGGEPSRFGFGGIGIDMSSGTAEEAADRALSSVSRKLNKSLSVQCAVNELIAEAADVTNLASMFYGWCAFL